MKRFLALLFLVSWLFNAVTTISAQSVSPSVSPSVSVSPTQGLKDKIQFNGSPKCFTAMKGFESKLNRINSSSSILVNYTKTACDQVLGQDFEDLMSNYCDGNLNLMGDDNRENNQRLRDYFYGRISPQNGGVCAQAVGTNNDPDSYRQSIEIGTEGQLKAIVDSLQCGVYYQKGANRCCAKENFENADSNIFSAIPHKCLILGEICIDELTNLFVGDTIQDVVTKKSSDLDAIKNEFVQESPECIVGQVQRDVNDPFGYYTLPGCFCTNKTSELCDKYISLGGETNAKAYASCKKCMDKNTNSKDQLSKNYYMYTALGCIDAAPQGLVNYVFSLGIGLAGGIALMCIIYSAIKMQTSMGSSDVLESSRELLTSCITGLILIIFSVFILRVIGVDILRIPGFIQ